MSAQIDYILVLSGTVVILATIVTLALYIVLSTKRELATRKRNEAILTKSREQLRNLAAYLQSAREDERIAVAREIHDELGQALTAIKMDIYWLRRRLTNKNQNNLIEKMSVMIELINNTIQIVKRISTQLRTATLDNLGLLAALEWESEEFTKRMEIECRLTTNINGLDINNDCATAIYRITQEALTNVARHAQASKVGIDLKYDSGRLSLEISDNGIGISEEQLSSPNSFGLMGVRERALQYGGEFSVDGVKEKGTKIRVSLPV